MTSTIVEPSVPPLGTIVKYGWAEGEVLGPVNSYGGVPSVPVLLLNGVYQGQTRMWPCVGLRWDGKDPQSAKCRAYLDFDVGEDCSDPYRAALDHIKDLIMADPERRGAVSQFWVDTIGVRVVEAMVVERVD